jgi:PAS domain S-box-containing protein
MKRSAESASLSPETASLPAQSEMERQIAALDWGTTAIGPRERWSPALRTTVRILLANRFPMLLWWGPDYISIYNDAYIPILGQKHPWGLGKPVRECWSEIWDVLCPLIDTPFYGGPSTWSEDIELYLNRSGFTEETHFTVAYSPVPDETAERGIGGVLATVHEITTKIVGQRRGVALRELSSAAEAKSAEEACRAAAGKLAAHTKDIPFALIYLCDENGTASLAAAAGLENAGALAPLSLRIADPSSIWPLDRAYATGQAQYVDLSPRFARVPKAPPDEAPREAAILPIRSHRAHQIAGFLIAGLSPRLRLDESYSDFLQLVNSQIATAISTAVAYEEERRRAEALAEIDRAKTAFFSNVSHEFRTPLTLMLGPLEEMLHEDGLPAAERDRVSIAHRNSMRLLKLVNSLLDFSRMEAGRANATYSPVDLVGLTCDLAATFRSALEAGGLRLIVDCEPLTEQFYVDTEMWEKIVLNLLSNAFKFTLEGSITVSLKMEGNRAALRVADTGIGIPASQLPHIFERFHRVEGARGRSHEGTGIGLALVQELTRMQGGEVSVESEEGKGTAFTVRIPAGKAHLPAERVQQFADKAPALARPDAFLDEALRWLPGGGGRTDGVTGGGKPRILLADDNTDMRDYVTRLLRGKMRVTACGNGQEALESALMDPPDLILSDVMMPVLDGFGLLRQLRADARTRDLPVILLSARAGEESRIEGVSAGADDYLVKPFSAGELLARVGTHLQLARVRRENLAATRRLQEVSAKLIGAGGFETLLREIVSAATAIVGAELGILQLSEDNHLRVAAHAGHEPPFLEFVSGPDADGLACFQALKGGGRMVAGDVETDSRFAGTKALEAMRAAGIRAVQSTPLFSRSGKLLGMLTTQWKRPHAPDENELGRLDLLVRQAADLIENSINAELLRISEERMALAIDAGEMGTWDMDLQTGAATWSRRQFEILGCNREEATTQLWRSRIHPDDVAAVDKALRDARASGERYASEHRIVREDNGEVRWVAEFGRYLQDSNGEPRRFVGISLDITERIQAARNSLLLGAIVDSSDDAIISKNLDGVITSWNKSAERLFGYTAGEAIGQTVAALLIPPDREDEEPAILARLARGERVDHFETVRRRKDGSLIDLSLTVSPVKDDRGRIIGASKIARDITERKQREARLRSSEERFRALVTASSDVVYQMSADWTRMRLVEGREFIADALEPSTAWPGKYIHPDDQPRVMEAIQAAIRNRSVFAMEHRIIRADGTPGWTFSRAVPILDEAGNVVEWFGAASDITDLKDAEKALTESEEHFRQLAEAGPQIVWLCNGKGELEFVNRRWVAYSGLDLAATRDPEAVQSRLHPEDDVVAKWRSCVSTATPFELEARLRNQDGEFRWFMMRSVPVMDQSGRVQRWFGTSTDIHESKMLQLELRRANQALEQFAYSASHDLQEPLRSVRIFSDMLFKRCGSRFDGQEREFLEYVRDGAMRMEMLLRDLLSYTQASKPQKPSAPVDACVAFEAALGNLAGAIAETKATIEADALPWVYVGATQLTQLFQNLVGNALKYPRPETPPVIHASAAKEDGNWVFSVRDNGIGIEPEFKERIFGLFKRLHTRDEYSGTGIGLAICQRIVESHGGRIWVESVPGEGSTFRFTIPV